MEIDIANFSKQLNNDFEAKAFLKTLPATFDHSFFRDRLLSLRFITDEQTKVKKLSYYFDCLDQKYSKGEYKIECDIILFDICNSISHCIKNMLAPDVITDSNLEIFDNCMGYICKKSKLRNRFFKQILTPGDSYYQTFLLLKKYATRKRDIDLINQKYLKVLSSTTSSRVFQLSQASTSTIEGIVNDSINMFIDKYKNAHSIKINDYIPVLYIGNLNDYEI